MNGTNPRTRLSEVLERLVEEYGNDPSQRAVLFQAALRVSADESRRAGPGKPTASLETLVDRARALIGPPPPKAAPETARSSAPAPAAPRPDQAAAPPSPPTPATSTAPAPLSELDLTPTPAPAPATPAAAAGAWPPAPTPELIPDPVPVAVAEPVLESVADEPAVPLVPLAPALERGDEEPSTSPGVPDADPLELLAPASSEPPDLEGFRSESSFEREGEAAPADETGRRPRARLVLALAGVVALALMGYVGLHRFGVIGPSGPSTATQPAPPAGAAARQAVPAPATAPAQKPQSAPAPEPVPPASTPAATPSQPASTPPAVPLQPPSTPAAIPAQLPPAGNAANMVSPTWVGRTPTYVVHFSSFRERGTAEREAARIGKQYGRPAYAAEVDLAERGIYYRVILGDFATAAAAREFRTELVAAGTPGVGEVYWVVAPKG